MLFAFMQLQSDCIYPHREIYRGCGRSAWFTTLSEATEHLHRRMGASTIVRCTKPSRRLSDQRFSWLANLEA